MPSTVVRNISYNERSEELTVTFLSGAKYVYYAVPKLVHAQFISSASKVIFLNKHIKNHYRYELKEMPD